MVQVFSFHDFSFRLSTKDCAMLQDQYTPGSFDLLDSASLKDYFLGVEISPRRFDLMSCDKKAILKLDSVQA